MVTITISNCGAGLNSDLTPEELGPGYWSASDNMRFANGYAQRFRGTAQIFTAPSVTPYFLAPYATSTKRFWVHAGLTAVYVDDGTTRTDITGTAPTGTAADRWTGGSLNGVLILNNGVDKPMFWNGDTGTNLATLTGWGATWKAVSVRPFKNFIIALGITKGATVYPHMVKWSDIAVPGAIPTSWDEANPALDAGENDLAETSDILVDCLPMGDVNIVYKERSMYSMTYIGAPYIFRFQRLPGDVGMLARGCAVATPGGHVVLTAGDVIIHAGQGPTSIANATIRDYIFRNIDSTYYKRAFVTANPQKNEVWVCFPYGESSTCNKAAVWNWIDKTWSIRSLSNVTYGDFGQLDTASAAATWATSTTTWEAATTGWAESEYSQTEARLLLCHDTPLISLADTGSSDFGSGISASMERSGMSLGDTTRVKNVRAIYPVIDGTTGSTISIEVGAGMTPDAAPTWSDAQTFTIGRDIKIDAFSNAGRYLSVRFSSSGFATWRIRSFSIDYVNGGLF